jgi:hypothetical protein
MAVGDIITAVRYNNIQTTVEDVLGVGSGNFGYGQTTASNQVPVEKLVTASDMNNLYSDLDKIYRHQVNLAPSASISTISISNLIADDDNEPSDVLKGYADYESFTTSVAGDPARFRLHATQSTTDDEVVNLTFGSQWNTNLNGYYRATFTSANARRYFFNAGGRITFKVNLVSTASGGNVAKTNDWATMLSNSGTVSFGHNYTSSDNSGTGTAIGNYQLTNSEQQVYRKTGSGVYADNNYYIRAKNVSDTVIEFRIWMNEADTGSTSSAKGVVPIDEFVQGNLTHHAGYVTASGSYVSVAAPTITRQSNFSGS